MKRLKLLFVALALLCGVNSTYAQGWTASAPATGDFYLYNVGANAYLENGANWTSHAVLKSSGFVVKITAGTGVYTICTDAHYYDSNKPDEHYYFTENAYVDTKSSTNWIFEPVEGLTNTYKLKTSNGLYAYAAAGMYQVEVGTDPGTNKAYWKLVTAANRDASTGASATNPIEWTHKINNPRFDDNNSGWQGAPTRGGKVAETWQGTVSLFDDFNPCAEHFNKTYDTYQQLTVPNGTYAISVQGFYREGGYAAAAPKHLNGTESLNAIFYANQTEQSLMSIFEEAGKASGGKTATTSGIDGAFPNDMEAASYFFSAGLYWNTVYVQVTDGTLKFGVKKSTAVGDDWTIFDNFRLQYFGDCTINEAKFGALVVALNEAVEAAQGFINSNPNLSATQIQALQGIINANDNDDNAFTEESQYTTATETINNALAVYQAMTTPYSVFSALKSKVDAIAAVAYTETTSGSHTTFADAITAQATAAENATSAADITAATNALIAAIKTYIAGAEPANDGEYFDITCLMVNPNFDDSHNGWTYLSAPGVNWSNCEYYESEFDINQTVTGLPTGSYSLNVQAFQRPGWAGNVYNDYVGGTDNASSVLYINSITSNVKNIAADAQTTYKLGDGSNFNWPNDSRVGTEGNYKYVPNSQQGANLYFAAGLYDATCAAVVDEAANGSLKLGFKSTKTHVSGDWTIFDNFRLRYYGSSLLVYYKQYLPQLISEVETDLANNAYSIVTGKERGDLSDAIEAVPSEETENAYKTVIDNIIEKQNDFKNAKSSYERLNAAIATAIAIEVDHTDASSAQESGATTAASATMVANTLYKTMLASVLPSGYTAGFEEGEYAPYNTAAVKVFYTSDEVDDAKVAAGTTEELDAAITTCKANTEEVNAVNIALFTTGDVTGSGWTRTQTWGQHNNGMYSSDHGTFTYGEVSGYEMPLKANTVYKLTFNHKAWDSTNSENGGTVSVLYGEKGLAAMSFKGQGTSTISKSETFCFKTGEAGNYVFTLYAPSGRPTFGGVTIVKATADDVTDVFINENEDYTPVSKYSKVTLTRTIKVGVNTLVLPFSMTQDEVKATFGEDSKIYVVESYDTEKESINLTKEDGISANEPCLLKATEEGTSYTIEGRTIVAATDNQPTKAVDGVSMIGSYAASITIPHEEDDNNYVVSGGKLYSVDSNVTMKNTRAYISITAPATSRTLTMTFDGETTGIVTVENGELKVETGDIYDLSGRKVKNPANGVYIIKGKKVVK